MAAVQTNTSSSGLKAVHSSDSSISKSNPSNPGIYQTSMPSITAVKKRAKLMQAVLIVFAVIAIAALVLSAVMILKTAEQNEAERQALEKQAREVQHISALSTYDAVKNESAEDQTEDNYVLFSLYTSPPNANVYRDGAFIGTTPLEQKKLARESEPHSLIVALDGYEIVRKSITLDEPIISETLTLTERPVQEAVRPAEPKKQTSGSIGQNNAFVVPTSVPAKSNKQGGGKSKAVPSNSMDDIALPL